MKKSFSFVERTILSISECLTAVTFSDSKEYGNLWIHHPVLSYKVSGDDQQVEFTARYEGGFVVKGTMVDIDRFLYNEFGGCSPVCQHWEILEKIEVKYYSDCGCWDEKTGDWMREKVSRYFDANWVNDNRYKMREAGRFLPWATTAQEILHKMDACEW